jgi:hypothetical protein
MKIKENNSGKIISYQVLEGILRFGVNILYLEAGDISKRDYKYQR